MIGLNYPKNDLMKFLRSFLCYNKTKDSENNVFYLDKVNFIFSDEQFNPRIFSLEIINFNLFEKLFLHLFVAKVCP
jgi:hypothetical protein